MLFESPVRVTVSETLPTFSTTLAVGALNCRVLSSSRIVTVALTLVPSEASPSCTARPIVNVSVNSTTVSLVMPMMIVWLMTLVPKVSTRFVAPPKSAPASAVPLVVL